MKKKSERATREPAARTSANRRTVPSLPTLDDAGQESVPSSYGAVVDQSLETARLVVKAVDATARGAVERGVETAYMVIDEYMRRGRTAAGRHQHAAHGGNSGGTMNQRNSQYSNYGGPGGQWNQNPLMAPWLQMMRLWTDSMMAFVPGGAAYPFGPWSGAGPQSGSERTIISVQTVSQTPIEVTLNVDPDLDNAKLTADPLMNAGNVNAPPIASTSLISEPGRIRVRVTVPNDQPAGHYRGAVRDGTGRQRGELSVDVEATPT